MQDEMDDAACLWSMSKMEVCANYNSVYAPKKAAWDLELAKIKSQETDRKAEWRGLQRMKCLIDLFATGTVNATGVDHCKNKTHSTSHLDIVYPGPNHPTIPEVPDREDCTITNMFPNTDAYKLSEYDPLPAEAQGKVDANECSGLTEVSTTCATGSPADCKCEIVVATGYSAGALLKCVNAIDVKDSSQANSCPTGTKLFSPRTREDWVAFATAETDPDQPPCLTDDCPDGSGGVADPNWMIDVTRPQDGNCPGCEALPMTSTDAERRQLPLFQRWVTSDGSPWWLRNNVYEDDTSAQPSGDYFANCYMSLSYLSTLPVGSTAATKADSVTFDDQNCQYHSKAYYCQTISVDLTAKDGSPDGCQCKKVEVTGTYLPNNVLIKCTNCLDVYRSEQKNSCPYGTKIFSPETRADWRTFLSSAMAVRSPHWIIDVTRPQSGCGDCKDYPMASTTAEVATWKTKDLSPWFLRDTVHVPANDDYKANCYFNLFAFDGEDSVIFDVGEPTADHPTEMGGTCHIHSSSYYCQSMKTTTTTTTTTLGATCSSLYTDAQCPSGKRKEDTDSNTFRCSNTPCVSGTDDEFCCQAKATCDTYQTSYCSSGQLVDNAAETECSTGTTCTDGDADDALCCKASCATYTCTTPNYGLKSDAATTALPASNQETTCCEATHVQVSLEGSSYSDVFHTADPIACGTGEMVGSQSVAHGTSSDCEARDECVIDVNAACQVRVCLRDRCASKNTGSSHDACHASYPWSEYTTSSASSGSCVVTVTR